MSNVLDILGNFHPLLLHVPIGVLIYAFLHLGFDLFIKKKNKPVDIHFALGIGAITSVLSAISGYLLSQNGEYGGELLEWHKWLGVGTAIGSVLLFLFYLKINKSKQFYGLFAALMILLTLTGHYGGSLTHGEGFLTTSNVEDEEVVVMDVMKAQVFGDLVMPIAKRKCNSCHNPKKKKGELLLNTLDGWKRGGKEGQIIIPGDQSQSTMFSRIHLPLSEKKHMPPKGKLQLDKEEVVFIDWWINAMQDYSQTVEDLSPPEHIMKYIRSKLDMSIKNVPPIDESVIRELQSEGLPISLLTEDKPWLTVDYKRGSEIKMKDIKKILKYNKNIRAIHLSKTNLTDKMLSKFDEFTNLQSLDISLNPITNSGIAKLKALSNLEHLNLYGTNVDAEMLDYLTNFPALNNLYLWQTKVTKSDISSAKLSNDLSINVGQDLDVFGTVQLLPPTIENEKEIFTDTISVALSHVAENAKIYYTMDGDAPNSSSQLYREPILLNKSATVKALVRMNGWEDSKVISKSFLKSTCIPVKCEITPPPNEKYQADGGVTLINSIKGSEQFADGKWLGFNAQDVSITLDLGEEKNVQSLSFGSLQDYRSYIFSPIGASISHSVDGLSYQELRSEKYTQITGPEDNQIKNYIIDIPVTNTRYLKLDIISQKKNPSWHADPGADCWLFLDEVVVE